MTAPTRTRPRPERRASRGGRGGTRSRTAPQRTAAQRGRSTAAQKAYARRAQRSAVVGHDGGMEAATPGILPMLKLRLPQSRASFVLLMMALLVAGVALTLWLSTQAIADSYRLESVRTETADLAERADRLQREVAKEESAASLADKAEGLGMVPSGHPARLVVKDSGKPKLVGEPTKAGGSESDRRSGGGADAG